MKSLLRFVILLLLSLLNALPSISNNVLAQEINQEIQPYDYFYAPSDSFGIKQFKLINDTYFETWFNDNTKCKLEGQHPINLTWMNATEYLIETYTYDNINKSFKMKWNFTSPKTAKYRLTYGFNTDVIEYINKSTYEVLLNYTVDNEIFHVFFNFSDLKQKIENGSLIQKHGFKTINNETWFWFRVRTVNPIQKGKNYILDPLFGETDVLGTFVDIRDLQQLQCIAPSSGRLDNFTVYLTGLGATEVWKVALYDSNGNKIVESAEQTGGINGGWNTVNINAYIFEGLIYNLSIMSSPPIYTYYDSDPAFVRWNNDSVVYIDGFPDPNHGNKNADESMSIYASFTENATIPFNPCDWSYAKKITINSSLVEEDLTNFPILINITSNDFINHARPDCYDVVFTNETNQTKFNHEIERYIYSTGQLLCWVNVTVLSSSVDTIIWLFYGNKTTGTQENIFDTWDDNFVGVWHMNTELNSTDGYIWIKDSTQYENHGFGDYGELSDEVEGTVGYAQKINIPFTSPPEYFDCGNDPSITTNLLSWSMELWGNHNGSAKNKHGFFGFRNDDWMGIIGRFTISPWQHIIATSPANYQYFDNSPINLSNNITHYIVSTITGNDTNDIDNVTLRGDKIFMDKSGSPYKAWSPWGKNTMRIGSAHHPSVYYVIGIIDEVRISNIVRSNGWINTTYETIYNCSNFISVGSEQLAVCVYYNDTPIIISIYPTNNSVELCPFSLAVNITITHINGTLMDIEFEQNLSGSWNKINEFDNVANGSYPLAIFNFTKFGDDIWIRITVYNYDEHDLYNSTIIKYTLTDNINCSGISEDDSPIVIIPIGLSIIAIGLALRKKYYKGVNYEKYLKKQTVKKAVSKR